jgi:hypothetical protein
MVRRYIRVKLTNTESLVFAKQIKPRMSQAEVEKTLATPKWTSRLRSFKEQRYSLRQIAVQTMRNATSSGHAQAALINPQAV